MITLNSDWMNHFNTSKTHVDVFITPSKIHVYCEGSINKSIFSFSFSISTKSVESDSLSHFERLRSTLLLFFSFSLSLYFDSEFRWLFESPPQQPLEDPAQAAIVWRFSDPHDSRRARFDKSNTRSDTAPMNRQACTENGAHSDEAIGAQACLPACLPASCLPPACLPRSAANSPRPPRCLSREWPVYMLTLCLRVSLPLPNPRLPPLSRPGTDDPRNSLSLCTLSFSFFVRIIDGLLCRSLSLPSSLSHSICLFLFIVMRIFAVSNKAWSTLSTDKIISLSKKRIRLNKRLYSLRLDR